MNFMELLNFIFTDFWHFIGSIILLGVVGEIIVGIFKKR